MEFQVNSKKATQAAAYLLKKNEGRLNYTKMLKLLYLADRRALKHWHRPIVGGEYWSLDNGPVMSEVYDWISGSKKDVFWNNHIVTEGYFASLLADPGIEKLSQIEEDLLSKVDRRFKKYSYSDMIEYCHKLREWKHPNGSRIRIQNEELLLLLQKDKKEIEEIEGELEVKDRSIHTFKISK